MAKNNTARSGFSTAMVKIILPVVLTLVLFVMTIFLLILPYLENAMMERKREMIRELTETAWSTLAEYHAREGKGDMTRDEAKAFAVTHLRDLRYGPDWKDYFWINDMQPRLIMHPYRTDLEGKDISDVKDPSGKRLFVEMVQTVREQGAGYVDYLWQWKDDPNRIVPKISYVKGFEPWGWIIGTGIYVEDVRAEIEKVTHRLTLTCIFILVITAILSTYNIVQGINVENERRRAEEDLRKSEEKYRLLVETAREIILTLDTDLNITYVNPAGCRKLLREEEALLGSPVAELLPGDFRPGFLKTISRPDSLQEPDDLFETALVRADGERIPVETASGVIVEKGHVAGFLVTARDVTEKKRSEERARVHREQLFQASKMASLGTLVSGVAHEVNNPITSVMLNAPLLKKAWEWALPILDEHAGGKDVRVGGLPYSLLRERLFLLLDDIFDGAKRVKAIVGDLKDFARQGTSEMKDRVDANQAVKKAVGLVSNLIHKSTGRFEVSLAEDLPVFTGNSQRIEQVIINLLVNACQAIEDNRRGIFVSTRYDESEKAVCIRVRDEGVGIPEEAIKRIVEPFFTTKRDKGGTGLGLAISSRIIEDHGGRLEFTSEKGVGTSVDVRLFVRGKAGEVESA